jgi:hypothetical protein
MRLCFNRITFRYSDYDERAGGLQSGQRPISPPAAASRNTSHGTEKKTRKRSTTPLPGACSSGPSYGTKSASRITQGRSIVLALLLKSIPTIPQGQIPNIRVSLAADKGWDVTATVDARVVAVRHCTDWHRVEHLCSHLRNERKGTGT